MNKTNNYSKLQNGSDIRGVALAGYQNQEVNLTPKIASDLAIGFLRLLQQTSNPKRIAIGHDSRLSASSLKEAMINRLLEEGVDMIDCGLASTPAMFMSTIFEEFSADGAMMITASHLPYNRNGIKFFHKGGGLQKEDITNLIALSSTSSPSPTKGTLLQLDLLATYSKHLRKMIINQVNHPIFPTQPLTGLHIVVDAGNGAGGFYATQVLAPLGANISGSQFLEPDGMFPNHIPNPENEEAMQAIISAVNQNQADLGLIFDTDVDRSSAVDHEGNEIARNGIIALAASLVREQFPTTTIVTDSLTSNELTTFIEEELHLQHHRFKRGYKNVINEAIRLNQEGIDAQVAIETSGHAAFKENFFLDDGAYLATKIVIETAKLHLQGRKIQECISTLKHPLFSKEFRCIIQSEDFSTLADDVLSTLLNTATSSTDITIVPKNYEGIRLQFEHANGWCLLRKSLHDPVLALNIESNKEGGTEEILHFIQSVLSQFSYLNLSELTTFLQ